MFASNLTVSQNTAQKSVLKNKWLSSTQKGKIHHVWHPIENYQAAKWLQCETKSIETNLEMSTNFIICGKNNIKH